MTDLTTKAAEIRAGLEGVTPGPWTAHLPEGGAWSVDADHLQETVYRVEPWSPEQDEKDAAHIARLDPATVLAFLDERDQHLDLIEQQAAELDRERRSHQNTRDSRERWKVSTFKEQRRATTAESERDKALAELDRLRKLCTHDDDDICQTLGKALGYPWYKDDQSNFPGATEENGVCVGEHVAASIAAEAAKRLDALTAAEAERDRLAGLLDRLVNAKAISGVRDLVAGWNGENRPDGPYPRHDARLGATLPKANCGQIYELDDAMQAARAAIGSHAGVPYRPRNLAEADKDLRHDQPDRLRPHHRRLPHAADEALSSTEGAALSTAKERGE